MLCGGAAARAKPAAPIEIAYGSDARQRFDVYLPAHPQHAPIVVMVHGGGWVIGNKRLPQVVEHKVERWLPRGAIFVSVGYRLVPLAAAEPGITPLEQAGDVAQAIARVQQLAPGWGGDAERIVLMGHSAGAHLVALLSASPSTIARRAGARPWHGTVVLDSAALNLGDVMRLPHARLYDRAFGSDAAAWPAMSPTDALAADALPMLLVCSTRRADASCLQSNRFAARVRAQGVPASVLEEDLTHNEVNRQLGVDGPYTDAVERFFASIGIELH